MLSDIMIDIGDLRIALSQGSQEPLIALKKEFNLGKCQNTQN